MSKVVEFSARDNKQLHTDGTIHHHAEHGHKCCGGHGHAEDHVCCGGAGHGDPNHVCGCKSTASNVSTHIHLEDRSFTHCVYAIMMGGLRAFEIAVDKQDTGIVVKFTSSADVPAELKGKYENETHTFESVSAGQYVELYDADENLIPEERARVLLATLRAGILDQIEGHLLDDGYTQKMISVEESVYSVVTHPTFDRNLPLACSCASEDGFYSMAGLA